MSKVLTGQLIIFSLAERLFGLDVTLVQEILPAVPLRSLPKSVPHLRGLIDFRGQIIPVINLRRLLGLQADDQVRGIIVVQMNNHSLGLMVDRVEEVLSAEARTAELNEQSDDLPAQLVLGTTEVKTRNVVVLRAEAIFASLQGRGGSN